MANSDDFRRIALSFPGAEEKAHMSRPDFRVGGRIFATLHWPDLGWGMVKVLPDEQRLLMHAAPEAFKPAAGAWGRQGSTLVRLDAAGEWLNPALFMAWQNRAPPKLRRQLSAGDRPAKG